MTIDSPLTCYICGKTSDRQTVDMIGCLVKQEEAAERFKEKFGKEPEGYLDICPDCEEEHPHHAKNVKRKYGVYGSYYEKKYVGEKSE